MLSNLLGILRRGIPLFAIFALALPGLVALVVAPQLQAGLATIGITLATISAAMMLYRVRAARVALHTLLLLIPLAVFYRVLYHGSLSPGVVLSILSTTRSEASELLAKHAWITSCLVVFVVVALLSTCGAWWAKNPFRRGICVRFLYVSVCVLALWSADTYWRHGELHNLNWALKDSARDVFPIDVVLSTRIVAIGELRTKRAAAARNQFRFSNVRPVTVSDEPQIIVVVIGESSRRRNWSLYGYPRPTTPRLDEIRNGLIVFDNAASNANITMYSLGLLLTRAAPTTWGVATREKSVITLLRQGGYSVHWISNQERYGFSENPVSAISLEANSQSFSNDYASDPKSDTLRDPYDSNLLPRLDEQLERFKENGGNTVVFLHMMGSHDAYHERYPKTFGAFQGRSDLDPRLTQRQQRLVDEYDNSIRFTDFVLASILQKVSELGKSSALLYFSDHGERLFEPDQPNVTGHGFPVPSRAELEIPFLMWLSPSFSAAHPEFSMRLQKNVHMPVQLENVFETLVDLAGLTYDGREERASLLAPDFDPHSSIQVLSVSQEPFCFSMGESRRPGLDTEATQTIVPHRCLTQ